MGRQKFLMAVAARQQIQSRWRLAFKNGGGAWKSPGQLPLLARASQANTLASATRVAALSGTHRAQEPLRLNANEKPQPEEPGLS